MKATPADDIIKFWHKDVMFVTDDVKMRVDVLEKIANIACWWMNAENKQQHVNKEK